MTVVAAFLVPGTPLPYLEPNNPPWARLVSGYKAAGRALASARPDVILVYSTQWMAVLDELWQTRPVSKGVHVDENWYQFGDLPFEIHSDVEVAEACVAGSAAIGIKAKGVNYDDFPIDTGTIVANAFLNPTNRYKLVIAANNLYHGFEETRKLGEMAARAAGKLGRKVAVVGIGGLSGTVFRQEIDIRNDRIAEQKDDDWNRRILALMEQGDGRGLAEAIPDFAREAKAEMGFKHMAWILGALGGRFYGARVHAYGPAWGSGAAVVEFKV